MDAELDALDACVFSSDALESLENRHKLQHFIDRWQRALKGWCPVCGAGLRFDADTVSYKECATCTS